MIKVEKNVIKIDEDRVCMQNMDMISYNDNNITIITGQGNHTIKYETQEEAVMEFETISQKILENPDMFKVVDNIIINIANLKRTEMNSIPRTDGKKEHILVLRFNMDSPSIGCSSSAEMADLAYRIDSEILKKENAGV